MAANATAIRNSTPDIFKTLPRRARTLLAQIQAETKLSLATCAFLALRAAGLTQEAAYKMIRPEVSVVSARSLGCRLDRATARLHSQIPADAAQSMLGDWGTLSLTMHPDPNVALKAIDIGNRVLRRYADEGVSVNVIGDVKLATADESPRQVAPPQILGDPDA